MEKNNKDITVLFEKLSKIHKIWMKATEEQKLRISLKSKFIMDSLEELGVERIFSENLLMFGLEFLEQEFPEIVAFVKKNEQWFEMIEEIFKVRMEKMSDEDIIAHALARKANALIWVKEVKDEVVSIKVLAKKGRGKSVVLGEQLTIA